MKSIITRISQASLFFLLLFQFIACDTCDSSSCENGSCENNSCVCNDGYYKNNDNCIAVNKKYVGTGTVNASQVWLDNQGTTTTPPNVELTLIASTTDTYTFTLYKFKGQAKNDIVFEVSKSNSNLLENATIMTLAGNTYNISGSKTGSRVSLTIHEPGGTSHTLKYGA